MSTPCEQDPEMWFSDKPTDRERAAIACMDCPIREACLAGAVERGERAGIWGGADLNPRSGPRVPPTIPKRCRGCGRWMVPTGRVDKFRARRYCSLRCSNSYHGPEWSIEDARRAHAAYFRGERDEWTVAGERSYCRQLDTRRRAKRDAA